MIRAVAEFIKESSGLVPLAGSLPDMHSSTESYTKLHRVFHEKSVSDVKRFTTLVKDQLIKTGLSEDGISASVINMFSKHCNSVSCLDGFAFEEEYKHGPKGGLLGMLEDLDHPSHFYVSLFAANEFTDAFKRLPGINDNEFESDFREMKRICQQILSRWNCRSKPDSSPTKLIRDDVLSQFIKYGFAELHPMCSFIGGIVSEETIKLLTNQYVPMSGTFLYVGLNTPTMAILQQVDARHP